MSVEVTLGREYGGIDKEEEEGGEGVWRSSTSKVTCAGSRSWHWSPRSPRGHRMKGVCRQESGSEEVWMKKQRTSGCEDAIEEERERSIG